MIYPITLSAGASSLDNKLASLDLNQTHIPLASVLAGNITASNPSLVFVDTTKGILKYSESAFWEDEFNFCEAQIECSKDNTTGYNDNTSARLTSSLADERPCTIDRFEPGGAPCLFSYIRGSEISDIKPGEKYSLITHMRENENVVQSHIALEGFNQTSQAWYQLTHCPTGTDGPLNWTRFSCEIIIPTDTLRIRPVLFSGWSSNPNNNATTWFDEFYIVQNNTNSNRLADVDTNDTDISLDSILNGTIASKGTPGFVFMNKDGRILKYATPAFWEDKFRFCEAQIECSRDNTTGFNDNTSARLSTKIMFDKPCTTETLPCAFAWLYGGEISDIKPGEKYSLITHMRENENVVQSHIALEGFNQTSQAWYQLTHCPTGTDGPLNWTRFSCEIIIPTDTLRIRPVLFSGWSSNPNNNATTSFDEIYLVQNNTNSITLGNIRNEPHNGLNPFFTR